MLIIIVVFIVVFLVYRKRKNDRISEPVTDFNLTKEFSQPNLNASIAGLLVF